LLELFLFQRYTLNPNGSPYGFAQIPKQTWLFRPKAKSSIENLYFASAWAYPGSGYTATILGGYLCAKEILSLN